MNAISLSRLPDSDPRVQRKLAKIKGSVGLLKGAEGVETDLEKKREHLEKLVSYHEKRNPLISFIDYIGDNITPDVLTGVVPLVFKLADPGIKFLNDDLLGITDTDEFIADLQRLILSMCAEGGAPGLAGRSAANGRVMKVLSMGFKGGTGLYKGDIHEERGRNMSFAGKIRTFNIFMNDIFQVFLIQKLGEELEKEDTNIKRVEAIASTLFEYGAEADEIAEILGEDSYQHPDGDESPQSSLKLNFGFGKWPEVRANHFGLKQVLMGLMHSEFNANALKLRQKLDSNVIDFNVLNSEFSRLTTDFWLMAQLKDSETIALFTHEGGEAAAFLVPAVESAYYASSLESDYPGLSPKLYNKIERYYEVRDEVSDRNVGGVGDDGSYVRELYKESSFERSIAFQLIDFVRERRKVRAIWKRAQRVPDSPEAQLFDPVLAQQGSFFKPAVIDAVRKEKLREKYPDIADENVYRAIERYYLVVNVLDILKPFAKDNVDDYVDFQVMLHDQVDEARVLLDKGGAVDVEALDEARRVLADYAQISSKDEDLQFEGGVLKDDLSEYRSKTHVGFMNAYLKEGSRTELREDRQLLEMDFIGFGAVNFQALVQTITAMTGRVLNHLESDVADVLREKGGVALSTVQRAQLIESALQKKPRVKNYLWEDLLGVADVANRMLADARNKLGAMPFVAAVNVDGGDELEVLIDTEMIDESGWLRLKELAHVYALRVVPFTSESVRTTYDLAQAVVVVEDRFTSLKREEKADATGEGFVSTNFCPVKI